MRYSSLFRSRWLALFWSVGIIWTALDVSGSFDQSDDATTNAASDNGAAGLSQVQDLVGKLKSS